MKNVRIFIFIFCLAIAISAIASRFKPSKIELPCLGKHCPKIYAAALIESPDKQNKAFDLIARYSDLSSSEQKHLIDTIVDGIAAAEHKTKILIKLARSKNLLTDSKAHLLKRIDDLPFQMDRDRIKQALKAEFMHN